MKPRIFINIHYLEIGGAETSLIGLLQSLDPQRVQVDLFLNAHRGEMMRFIPSWINVLPEIPVYSMIERPIKEAVRKGFIRVAMARLWAKWKFRGYAKRKHPMDGSAILGYVGKYVTPVLPSLKHLGEYDLAISFLTPHDIVLDKVRAKKKICWIHTDYSQIDVDSVLEYPVWNGYDHIISISEDVTRTFCRVFPALEHKITQIENILSPRFIRQQADNVPRPTDMVKGKDGYTLLTIGRYSYPKKLEEIPLICRCLTNKGLQIKWYIIGYGSNDGYIRKAIREERMEQHVFLLGKRNNPYPYIKACDWYVQPSRYEGKSIVVREAQILCKPVIITAYPTANSQIRDGVDGVIVPLPVEECAEGIYRSLTDKALESKIISYLANHDYGNEEEVNKIYSFVAPKNICFG